MTLQYFPIVACAPTSNPDAAPYDKRWLVIDGAGRLLMRKQYPALAQITVAISFGYLAIRAPGMLRMDIPLDVIEDDDSVCREITIGGQQIRVVDEGDLTAAWMSNYLGAPSRLVKIHPESTVVFWPEL
ncbi:MAG TPA: MOSC N-terminal beta barrel domain-containing protein [Eoetvoesiella sp.]